jgi:hypothetical protein
VVSTSCSTDGKIWLVPRWRFSGSLLVGGESKVISLQRVPGHWGQWQDRVKARRDADNGDIRGAVTSLEASSWCTSFFPASSTEGNPRALFVSGDDGVATLFPPWGCRLGGLWCHWCMFWSRWWLPLKAWAFGALCTPPSVLRGRRLLWSGSAPLLTRRLLGAYGRAVRCAFPEFDSVS